MARNRIGYDFGRFACARDSKGSKGRVSGGAAIKGLPSTKHALSVDQ